MKGRGETKTESKDVRNVKSLFRWRTLQDRNLCAKKRRKHPLKIDSVPVALLEATIKHSTAPQDFLKHILNKLRDDIVGTLCKQDQIIVKLGIIFYGRIKRKKDKKVQVSMQVFYIHDGFSKPFETPSF